MVRPSIEIKRKREGGKKGERQYVNEGMSEFKILRAKNCQRGERIRDKGLLVFEILK